MVSKYTLVSRIQVFIALDIPISVAPFAWVPWVPSFLTILRLTRPRVIIFVLSTVCHLTKYTYGSNSF